MNQWARKFPGLFVFWGGVDKEVVPVPDGGLLRLNAVTGIRAQAKNSQRGGGRSCSPLEIWQFFPLIFIIAAKVIHIRRRGRTASSFRRKLGARAAAYLWETYSLTIVAERFKSRGFRSGRNRVRDL